jgi:hypothetical protein
MLFHAVILFFAAMAAGAVNSVAGGGTLLTFPALLATGQLALTANATSTVALCPGTATSWWGYRQEIGPNRHVLLPLLVLGVLGGVAGSYLLLITPAKTFDRIVPFLILAATLLFLVQEPLSRWMRARTGGDAVEPAAAKPLRLTPLTLAAVFLTAVYGGYFGAGIGIITLAVLSLLGMRDIHQMNGLKNAYALATNGVAAAIFIVKGLVDWRLALLMAAGALLGGYLGVGVARKLGQKKVRVVVIGIGLVLTVSMLFRH